MLTMRSWRIFPLALGATLCLSTTEARADGVARCVATLPFGAGQFQNGDTGLGIFFAASEAVTGAASIATFAAVHVLFATDVGPNAAGEINRSLRDVTMVNRLAFTAWATLAAAGIVEAHVNFAPWRGARRERPRPAITAGAAPIPGGGWLAVQGSF